MIAIRPLANFDPDRFRVIASGYSTNEIFSIAHIESDEQTRFDLTLEALKETLVFQFPFSEEDLERYATLVPGEYCMGAFDGDLLVGIALAEPQAWNRTLWVWEFHVFSEYRGRGIGRQLMETLASLAKSACLRAIICETQNTNVPAIRFYRAVGYRIEGIDISYYTNEDMLPGRTVAVFMKLRLE